MGEPDKLYYESDVAREASLVCSGRGGGGSPARLTCGWWTCPWRNGWKWRGFGGGQGRGNSRQNTFGIVVNRLDIGAEGSF